MEICYKNNWRSSCILWRYKILLQRNNLCNDGFEKYFISEVESCQKFNHTSKPKVIRNVSVGSLNCGFNKFLCIDHLHLEDTGAFHTRFFAAVVVKTLAMQETILALETNWISPYFTPEAIQFDQAFNNRKFQRCWREHGIISRLIFARRHNNMQSKVSTV